MYKLHVMTIHNVNFKFILIIKIKGNLLCALWHGEGFNLTYYKTCKQDFWLYTNVLEVEVIECVELQMDTKERTNIVFSVSSPGPYFPRRGQKPIGPKSNIRPPRPQFNMMLHSSQIEATKVNKLHVNLPYRGHKGKQATCKPISIVSRRYGVIDNVDVI